ncbi:alpha/beta fold hydrolase [Glycomyces paridis]|uniref:Alpha/beta hydrolase n=1 Tax=Glycomyces paridis TaxID=2126555 RepID=A0A4S8P272_9ACTN|nr:alpha/beta fold hydrolase [Glycomyces paridis]THV21714.1 alpha/beta hydrolase [Glycomyces paridis]
MTTGLLPVDGATIYFEQRGTGPLLLIAQSGEGDADRSVDLVNALQRDFTCLTYDRRGLSRSAADDPARVTIADHAEDAHRLLTHLADGPALMLGCSFGALIGLHLAADHPEQVRTLIAHEPVAPWLLPDAAAAAHRRELADLQQTHATDGLAAALPAIAASLGIDPASPTEPDLTPQPMNALRRANFAHFITNEFTAIRTDPGCRDRLNETTTRIIPAAGTTTPRTAFDHQAAAHLAELLDRPLTPPPGGHNGNLTHPRAWADHLRAEFSTR